MNGIVVFALIALVHTAASAPAGYEEFIAEKCPIGDAECFTKGVGVFLKKIADGVPKLDIKAFDPYESEDIKVNVVDNQFAVFKNVKITGFKEQDILDFVIGKDTNTIKNKVHFVANSTIFVKGEKEHESPYTMEATVTGAATFPKEIKKQADGKDYVILGEGPITCEVEGTPKVTMLENVRAAILADPILQSATKHFTDNMEEYRKKIACAFFEEAFKAVGSNMRKFLAAVPKADLYKH